MVEPCVSLSPTYREVVAFINVKNAKRAQLFPVLELKTMLPKGDRKLSDDSQAEVQRKMQINLGKSSSC